MSDMTAVALPALDPIRGHTKARALERIAFGEAMYATCDAPRHRLQGPRHTPSGNSLEAKLRR